MMLQGRRILVVEDEPLVALDLEAVLTDAGAEVLGPAMTMAAAEVLARRPDLSAAVLDVRVGGFDIGPVAELLHQRSVPFVLHTGWAEGLDKRWPAVRVLLKPSDSGTLVSAVAELL